MCYPLIYIYIYLYVYIYAKRRGDRRKKKGIYGISLYKCISAYCNETLLEGFSDRDLDIDKVTNGVRNGHKPSYKVGPRNQL